MNIAVATYDPKQIIIAFGALVLSGFSDGTFVKITRSGDAFEKKRGADGSVERVNKNAFDFGVSVTLQQTSAVNALLSAALTADQISNLGVLPLTIKDLNGTSLFEAPQAWIKKDPEAEYADTTGGREWQFETGPGAYLCGGNT